MSLHLSAAFVFGVRITDETDRRRARDIENHPTVGAWPINDASDVVCFVRESHVSLACGTDDVSEPVFNVNHHASKFNGALVSWSLSIIDALKSVGVDPQKIPVEAWGWMVVCDVFDSPRDIPAIIDAVRERDAMLTKFTEALGNANIAALNDRDVIGQLRRGIDDRVTTLTQERDDVAEIATRLRDEVRERDAEIARLREREAHFARALGVADGGRYRADWNGAIRRLIERAETADATIAAMRETVRQYLDAIDSQESVTPEYVSRCNAARDALRALVDDAKVTP